MSKLKEVKDFEYDFQKSDTPFILDNETLHVSTDGKKVICINPDGEKFRLRIKKLDSGQHYVEIGENQKTKEIIYVPIDKLVTQAYLGPIPDGYMIWHIDGDYSNDTASNLAYHTLKGVVDIIYCDNRSKRKTEKQKDILPKNKRYTNTQLNKWAIAVHFEILSIDEAVERSKISKSHLYRITRDFSAKLQQLTELLAK